MVAKKNWISFTVDYTIISEKQAQDEHVALSHSQRVGEAHQSKSWKDCKACKQRFKTMKVKVMKK